MKGLYPVSHWDSLLVKIGIKPDPILRILRLLHEVCSSWLDKTLPICSQTNAARP